MSGVDDERKTADYLRRYSGNPFFAFGVRAYGRYAHVRGFFIRVCRWWRDHVVLLLRFFTCLALAAFLICASSLTPIDNRGWYSVRRAYAVAGVDDVMFGSIIFGLLLVGGAAVANRNGNVDFSGIATDFNNWASENLSNTVWENGSEWVNPTASGSGNIIDVSKVPDDVLKGVMDYGAHLSSSDNVSPGVVPDSVRLSMFAKSDPTSNIVMNDTVNFQGYDKSSLNTNAQGYPFLYVFSLYNNRTSRHAVVLQTNMSVSYYHSNGSLHIVVPAGCSYRRLQKVFNSVDAANPNMTFITEGFYEQSLDAQTVLDFSQSKAAAAVWHSQIYSPVTVADVPNAISTPIQAYQADPTDENAQAAIDAIRAANPSVALPEEAPQVVNNYNEYVTVNSGSGEVVDPSTPSEFDLTGLADAIAQALGGGATIAAVLAALRSVLDGMVTSDALAGEFAGIDSLLRQLVNLEQRAEQWRQQQELNADLDEIIRLLTSIDENVSGILQDMANLDRSTGDLVNLQPVIDAINGLQMPSDPVATDLSSLEHQLLDMTDSDGVTLTVHGLLHWINYYLQDIDRFLHDWNPYEPMDYSVVLGNIYDEISDFTNSFTRFWSDLNSHLNTIISDLENLKFAPRYPTRPYPNPPSNPETGIVPWEDMLNVNALRDAITRMMQKFPFATINNFVLILTMLVRPAQAPQFDLPLPNPSDWSDPYMVHVDLSIWDVPAAVLRTGTMLWAIARVSRRTVALWTSEEGGGEGV